MAKIITAKNDLAFKKVFANEQYPQILIGFLKDVLNLEVDSVKIENPYNIETFSREHEKSGLVHTIVDVLARLADHSSVSVELQLRRHGFFKERALYYAATRYTSNYGLKEYSRMKEDGLGAKYSSLHPVYGINILDFNLFTQDDEPLRRFSLYDITHQETYGDKDLLSLSFLELQKNSKKVSENMQKWMQYFEQGQVSTDAPSYMKEACYLIDYSNMKKEEREMIDAIELAKEDYNATMLFEREEGLKEGLKEGLEEGTQKTKIEIAKELLKENIPLTTIKRVTGLSADVIQKIQNPDLKIKQKAIGRSK